jgi:hypothetical protein
MRRMLASEKKSTGETAPEITLAKPGAAQAHRMVESRQVKGRIVLRV